LKAFDNQFVEYSDDDAGNMMASTLGGELDILARVPKTLVFGTLNPQSSCEMKSEAMCFDCVKTVLIGT
jgi:hypothetical protein